MTARSIIEYATPYVSRARERAACILNPPKDLRKLRLNRDTNLLKLVACIVMLCDHLGAVIFKNAYVFTMPGALSIMSNPSNIMRVIGRLAMPIFCYCIAVGCAYSRNVWKYMLRLFILGVLVQPLYAEAMKKVALNAFNWAGDFYRLDLIYSHYFGVKLNILFTLGFGVMLLGCIRARAYVLAALAALVIMRFEGSFDYGWKAIALMALFYAFLDNPLASFAAVFAFMLYWGMPSLFRSGPLSTGNLQTYALFALPLIYAPLKRRLKLPKWLFYAYYPAHLLLIYLLRVYVPGLS